MSRHRFLDLLTPPLPQPRPQSMNREAFCACPPALMMAHPQAQALYQAAYEHAQALLRPSLPERDLLACWN